MPDCPGGLRWLTLNPGSATRVGAIPQWRVQATVQHFEETAGVENRSGRVPAVSVIIPAYNVTAYIRDAIESVFAQTFPDYEVIVVNDGSPDTEDLERALAPYRDRIIYIKQQNRGLSGARNTGIRAARAPLVALLDADDMWEPEYLAVQVASMNADPSLDLLYPNGVIFGDVVEAGRECMSLSPSDGEVTFERLLTQECNVLVFVTARRQALIDAGLFDESLRSTEDFDLWLRMAKQGARIGYHRTVLARYRRRRGSLSSDPIWMLRSVLRVMAKLEARTDLTPGERAAVASKRAQFEAALRLKEGKKAFFERNVERAIAGLTDANIVFRSRKINLTVMLLRVAPRLLFFLYNLRDRYVFGATTKF